MKAIVKHDGMPVTMSSSEISDLTGKEHKNVIRDIRAMLVELADAPDLGDGSKLSHQFREEKDTRGYTSMFHLNRELTDTLLTGYSAVLRRKVIARWHELESSQAAPDPVAMLNDPAAMRGLLLGYTEKVIELEKTVAEQAPAVAGFQRIAKSDGSMCVTDAAKSLQVRPKDLTQLLQEKGWIYRRPQGKGYLAYQDKIQRGLMEHKVTTGDKGDGTEWTQTQARVTARGLTTLAEVIRQVGLH